MILTEELVERAVELLRPSAKVILETEGMTWGPKWVTGVVDGPGLDGCVSFELGDKSDWKEEWGDPSEFEEIADVKTDLARNEKMATSAIVALRPWAVDSGQYLYPGGVHSQGITVAVSGAHSRTDEGLADMLLCLIMMFCYQDLDKRVAANKMKMD